ncbi:MAG: hypothetical protein BGO10_03355 [Chlamydia sp. 32-24]|nr:MAG: hypothetical protein BGO10_03355 [Chlamydia sp. 32-24]
MGAIITNPSHLKTHIDQEKFFTINNGCWKPLAKAFGKLQQVFSFDNTLKEMIELLKKLEQLTPDQFIPIHKQNAELLVEHIELQKAYSKFIKKNSPKIISNPLWIKYKCLKLSLAARVQNIGYNHGIILTNVKNFANEELERSLLIDFEEWKVNNHFVKKKKITSKNLRQLANLPAKFISLIFRYPNLKQLFYLWIEAGNSGQVFVQYPSYCEIFHQSNMMGRNGYYGDFLHIENVKNIFQDLQLRIESKLVSILDLKQKVKLEYQYIVSIQEIFDDFSARSTAIGGKFEFFPEEGICNYNTVKQGSWDPSINDYRVIDLKDPKFYKSLKWHAEISFDKAKKNFRDLDGNSLPLIKGDWIFAIVGNNKHSSLDELEGTHGYLQIGIPSKKGYKIYSLGKFPEIYPNNTWNRVKFLVKIYPAVIMCPDENIFHAERAQASIAVNVTKQVALKKIEKLRIDLQNVRLKKLVFQIFEANCIKWAFTFRDDMTKEEIAILFGVSLLESNPSGMMGKIFSFIRQKKVDTQKKILDMTMRFLGVESALLEIEGNHEIISAASSTSAFSPNGKAIHPGKIVSYMKEKEINLLRKSI